MQKVNTSILSGIVFGGFPEYPIDLSAVNRLRMLVYVRSNDIGDEGGVNQIQVRLLDGGGGLASYTTFFQKVGWHESNVDLANPSGGSVDLSDVTTIQMLGIYADPLYNHDEEGLIVQRIYYTERDTGSATDDYAF